MDIISSTPASKERIVGIDLGTTHSLIAVVENGKPRILKTREGKNLLPSVVSLSQEGLPQIGYAAKKLKVREARKTLFSVKRLLGRSFQDIDSSSEPFPFEMIPSEGVVRVRLGDRTYTAIEISAMILRELKSSAEAELGHPVTKAVITVPAYFNDAQRQDTRTAGRLAGLDVLRIVNEPTAAALAYGLNRKKEGIIAVYDLGGGTFDISILKLRDGIFEVLATHGDTTLGGDDIDRAMASQMAKELSEVWGLSKEEIFADSELYVALLEASEKSKLELSESSQAVSKIEIRGKTFEKSWSTKEFNTLVLPLLERTREPCLHALKDAGVEKKDLADVILVGGPTRLRVVRDLAERIFEKVPNTSMHPDEVVAEGAAIQADILSGNNQDLLLLDVVPLSLGLETYGGLMSPLIHRNTRIPTVARENFTTFVDHQTAVDLHVLQGDRDRAQDNRSLARFKLRLKPAPAGTQRIEVTFLIDADGILQVAAKDLKTGQEQSIEVRPSFGLTDAEVEKMLLSGMENAQADVNYRKLAEARNDAEKVLRATEKAIQSAAFQQLSPLDMQTIRDATEGLKQALSQTDVRALKSASDHLNQVTVRLAELMVKAVIQK